MVTPVWSGVINAQKISRNKRAPFHLFAQKSGLTIFREVKISIKTGRRNVTPVAIKMQITHDINASSEKKGKTSSEVANGYINLKVKGII